MKHLERLGLNPEKDPPLCGVDLHGVEEPQSDRAPNVFLIGETISPKTGLLSELGITQVGDDEPISGQ